MSVKNNIDVSVSFISSSPAGQPAESDFVLMDAHQDFPMTGLKKSSVFKMGKVLTLERSKVLRRLGRVSPDVQKELDSKFKIAFGIK